MKWNKIITKNKVTDNDNNNTTFITNIMTTTPTTTASGITCLWASWGCWGREGDLTRGPDCLPADGAGHYSQQTTPNASLLLVKRGAPLDLNHIHVHAGFRMQRNTEIIAGYAEITDDLSRYKVKQFAFYFFFLRLNSLTLVSESGNKGSSWGKALSITPSERLSINFLTEHHWTL